MNLREIWAAAFARGEARGVEAGAAFRADVASRLDDAREEREARIRAEAYAQGREAGRVSGARFAFRSIEAEAERRVRDRECYSDAFEDVLKLAAYASNEADELEPAKPKLRAV